MKKLSVSAFFFANTAWAHEGHGAVAGHLHGMEYGLLGVAIVALVTYLARR